ncbi:MAG: transglutaminase domain-containing protein [Coprococcus sp.]
MVRKAASIIIIIGFLLLISGCGKKDDMTQTEATCYELALSMAYEDENRDNLVICNSSNAEYENMLDMLYGLKYPDDGCIIYSKNADATEYAVLRAKKENDYINTKEIEEAFKAYIDERIAAYTGYYPEGVEILENSRIFTIGEYVILDISHNPDKAKSAFEDMFGLNKEDLRKCMEKYVDIEMILEENRKNVLYGGNSIADNTETTVNDSSENTVKITSESQLHDTDDEIYYNRDIVTAYLENKPELLNNEKDIAILNKVSDIIKECINEDMTDLEKEKAIHDYMCINMDYDRQKLSVAMTPMEDSDNPYGMLINGFGICTGYASTFKLFMECLDIDCIVVEGMVYDYTDNHAWNKVKLGSTWYNVDVTWDDPANRNMPENSTEQSEWKTNYTFFNCSDEVLVENDHLWNKTEYPESYE